MFSLLRSFVDTYSTKKVFLVLRITYLCCALMWLLISSFMVFGGLGFAMDGGFSILPILGGVLLVLVPASICLYSFFYVGKILSISNEEYRLSGKEQVKVFLPLILTAVYFTFNGVFDLLWLVCAFFTFSLHSISNIIAAWWIK